MAYSKPAVQVYQELISSGGAANINPDLPACIVGPLKHIVTADLSDPINKAESLAYTMTSWIDVDPIELPSQKPGQVRDESKDIDVILANALVISWEEDSVASDANVGNIFQLTSNTRGTSGTNDIDSPLVFAADKLHVELGDKVAIAPEAGLETDITQTGQVIAIDYATGEITTTLTTTPGAAHKVFILKEFAESVPGRVDLVELDGEWVLDLGPTAGTYPSASPDSNEYTYTVDAGLVGGSTPMSVYMGYHAFRSDTINTITVINDTTDLENKFGNITVDNPLAFGVSLALANSGGTPIYAIATDPSEGITEDQAYTKAFELAEAQRLYWMVPLTTSTSVAGILKQHVNAMSLPESGNWRVGLTNFAIPEEIYILGNPNTTDGDDDGFEDGTIQAIAQTVNGQDVTLNITSGQMVGNTTAGDYIGDKDGNILATVESAQGFTIVCTYDDTAPTQGDTVEFYVSRTTTRQDEAEAVAAQCKALIDKRMLVFPGEVDIPGTSGANERVEGYYLMCAVAGMGSGFPPQTGFTNITIGGIAELVNGNFYFSENQLNLMAEAGAFLYVQNAQGTTPYCRHGLTTDVSVLEYREILKVKNWDYLSYYYKDILSPFIGTWNITADTLQTIRQTVASASETLLSRKLPKVGPPLLSYNIVRLEQNANSSDAIDLDIQIAIVSPNNYTNVYLQI